MNKLVPLAVGTVAMVLMGALELAWRPGEVTPLPLTLTQWCARLGEWSNDETYIYNQNRFMDLLDVGVDPDHAFALVTGIENDH